MFITPKSDSFKLCGHWLNNTKKQVINYEVLNLEISFHGAIEQTFEIAKTLMRTIMKEEQEEILEDSKNCFATKCYSMYIATTTDIPDIAYEQNRNIILVTPFIPNFNQFDRPILSVSFKDYSLDLHSKRIKDPINQEILYKLTNDLDSFAHKPYMDASKEAKYCFKKLPLLELMSEKKYSIIGDYIFNTMIMEKYSLRPATVLEHTEYLSNRYDFKALIADDIKMFVSERILTLRLSIIAYRLSLWEFDMDKSTISEFYSHKLEVGESIYLYPDSMSLSFISRDIVPDRAFLGYDLREDEESKQIQIAKNIIENQSIRYKGDFDEETIHEITHLSYDKINQLIWERG